MKKKIYKSLVNVSYNKSSPNVEKGIPTFASFLWNATFTYAVPVVGVCSHVFYFRSLLHDLEIRVLKAAALALNLLCCDTETSSWL